MAIERLQVYQCPHCGNTIEVIRAGGGELVCCGEPMQLLTENTTDAATEKHVPVVEQVAGGIKVKVGEVDHPMLEKHWIEWIEAISGDNVYRQFLNLGETPEAFFPIEDEKVVVRELCNLHGLWKAG
jgi:superoxide reductase